MSMMKCYLSLTLILLCLYTIVSFSNALNGGFSVEIIHRDSPKSPFYRSTETHFQRVSNAMLRSLNRANHFNSPNTAQATIIADDGEYLMSYSIGTPPFKLFGILDTGSDITWLQCQPCKTCYNQTTPIFNPSNSTSYKNLPCNSSPCKSLQERSCSSKNDQLCEYSISYGDGSVSQGDLSMETLTLHNTNGSPVLFPKTVIGCGYENTGTFPKNASGIVGFGGGPLSLISQINSSIMGKFSYCLAPMFSQSNSSSKLSFGNDAVISGNGTVSTPIVPQEPNIFYYVTLKALSVGNKRIEFDRSSSGEGNIIIDSGTTLTILPKDVYSNLESAVADAVKLDRVEDRFFSLCYNSTFDELDVPVITAHFSGADVKLNAINTFVELGDRVVCLAFSSSENGAIFGNLAQNFKVGYDLQAKVVSFKPTDCNKE